jgi:hypothetical protein
MSCLNNFYGHEQKSHVDGVGHCRARIILGLECSCEKFNSGFANIIDYLNKKTPPVV